MNKFLWSVIVAGTVLLSACGGNVKKESSDDFYASSPELRQRFEEVLRACNCKNIKYALIYEGQWWSRINDDDSYVHIQDFDPNDYEIDFKFERYFDREAWAWITPDNIRRSEIVEWWIDGDGDILATYSSKRIWDPKASEMQGVDSPPTSVWKTIIDVLSDPNLQEVRRSNWGSWRGKINE